MSLAGNLADLSLGDILQILSLSRKSGELIIRTGTSSVTLVFESGTLVAVTTHDPRDGMRRFLAARYGTERPFDAIARTYESVAGTNWTYFIQLYFQDPAVKPVEIARAYVQYLVNEAFSASAGTFEFHLGDIRALVDQYQSNKWIPILRPGLNPQFLAMEAARASDERDLSSAPAAIAPVAAPVVSTDARVPFEKLALVLVDDNPRILEVTQAECARRGLKVEAVLTSVPEATSWIKDRASLSNLLFCLDVVMPKADRSGVLGGMDVLLELRARNATAQAVMLVDVESTQIVQKVAALGAAGCVNKETRRGFREQGERAAADMLDAVRDLWRKGVSAAAPAVPAVVPTAAAAARPAQTPPIPSRAPATPKAPPDFEATDLQYSDLLRDVAATFVPRTGSGGETEALSGPLQFVQMFLDELADTEGESEVELLILRYAAEVFDRAILFYVEGGQIVGSGQTGLRSEEADRIVTRLRLRLDQPSVFKEVIASAVPYSGPLAEGPVHSTFLSVIEARAAVPVYVAPVLAGRRVVAVLYGDNAITGRSIAGTRSLHTFLRQAGMTLERAHLRQKVSS